MGAADRLDDRPAAVHAAVTVVDTRRRHWFDALLWGNAGCPSARRSSCCPIRPRPGRRSAPLVTTVDACPEYQQVNPDVDSPTWKAEPAIEGQGVYPSIVQEITHSAEGADVPGYRGHMLVGNTIVTWTAEAYGDGDRDVALATLGDAASLSAMVQDRAQAAVRSLP